MLAMAQTPTAAASQARHDGETRTARKRRAILNAATTLFLRDGYQATSMDQIAAGAAVSKQTVYKQFADKQSLFREIVTDTVAEVADPVAQQVASLRDSSDLEADLRDVAHTLLAQVTQPRVMQLRRLVIAEAGRFPDLGLPVLRLRSRPHHRCAGHRLSGPGSSRGPAGRRLADGRRALQLAGHVDPAQPGDALRRHRTARPCQPQPLRRRRNPGIPGRVRPELTSPPRIPSGRGGLASTQHSGAGNCGE